MHKPLGGDDHSDDELDMPLPIKAQKRASADLSCTETSSTGGESADVFEQFDALDLNDDSHSRRAKVSVKTTAVSPAAEKKPSLASFLDNDLAKSSTSTTRIAGKNGRASKGRSRRISGARSVCSLPAPRSSTVKKGSSNHDHHNDTLVTSSPIKSSKRALLTSSSTHEARSRVAHKAAAMSRTPLSAPTGRKQKLTLRNLPRTPALTGNSNNNSPVKGPQELYKSKSTRDLLREYNDILDDFDDSARGPRSQAFDLLEEYDQILTEYDDSARPDRNTPYSTGWR